MLEMSVGARKISFFPGKGTEENTNKGLSLTVFDLLIELNRPA
jgi:hypothetical protein